MVEKLISKKKRKERSVYDDSFKIACVADMTRLGPTRASKLCGVGVPTLYAWKKRFSSPQPAAKFSHKPDAPAAAVREEQAYRQQNIQVTVSRDGIALNFDGRTWPTIPWAFLAEASRLTGNGDI